MYKALILEDELLSAEHLENLISQIDSNIKIKGVISSVEEAVHWFKNNPVPDLLFVDIQLADGTGFEIFNQIEISCPVIFTTAYEEYAIRAFKVNSLDYLLKPVAPNDLKFALNKFKTLQINQENSNNQSLKNNINKVIEILTSKYKSRFITYIGPRIKTIDVENITMFFSLEKSTYILDKKGSVCNINYSLEEIEKQINPDLFFRINRKYIVNIEAVEDIITYSASRLKLKISGSEDSDILVSRSRLKDFKVWLEK